MAGRRTFFCWGFLAHFWEEFLISRVTKLISQLLWQNYVNNLPHFLPNKMLQVTRSPRNQQYIFIDVTSQQGDFWGYFSEGRKKSYEAGIKVNCGGLYFVILSKLLQLHFSYVTLAHLAPPTRVRRLPGYSHLRMCRSFSVSFNFSCILTVCRLGDFDVIFLNFFLFWNETNLIHSLRVSAPLTLHPERKILASSTLC